MVDDMVATSPGRGASGGLQGLVARFTGQARALWPFRRRSAVQSAAFTSAFVSLAAKMAAADGVAIAVEYDAFEQFLEVEADNCASVRHVYDLAKEDVTGFEVYADRIGDLLADDPETKRRVFECLMFIACSDGVLHPAEDHFLKTVACRLHYSDAEFRVIRAQFIHDPESPYAILDIAPDASLREIKSRYRSLVQLNHPDRLIAQGAPPAVIKAATVKLAAINHAYADIIKERDLSAAKGRGA